MTQGVLLFAIGGRPAKTSAFSRSAELKFAHHAKNIRMPEIVQVRKKRPSYN